ncbi:sigma-w pathway protein ysdB [Oceanobacillus saliphilus]|uniref:sigma-w pathway protein ysdB n=1 Tax=Oceanobacillus saliphilus TaxID=2925834 RepID=UPI00201DEAF3|nr:sigma-w pathway protein ysdB [Oceanobacillus saliphilus]
MVVILFRILLIIALALLVYTWIQYLRNPERRLQIAKKSKEFFFLDDTNNSKKNFQLVYKGCLFEGEKYLGTTEESFEVVDIHVTVRDPLELRGFTRDELYFLEKEILLHYPYAKITWKHPISELILTEIES